MNTQRINRILNLVVIMALMMSWLPASSATATSVTDAQAAQMMSVESLLNFDGTLNTHTGASGALDLRGWSVMLDSARGPILSHAASAPATSNADTWSALPNNGLNGSVDAIAVMGSDLYVGGWFTQTADGTVTNLNHIARYSGGTWSALTNHGLNGNVYALAVMGSDLYVGGWFTETGDGVVTNLNDIARYSGGGTWSALAHSGLTGGQGAFSVTPGVYALAVMGSDLYVGGVFTGTADVAVTNLYNIARYSGGGTWSALAHGGLSSAANVHAGSDVNGVNALAVMGSDLYVGGYFTGTVDSAVTNLNAIARYSGGAWSALANNGLYNAYSAGVTALAVSGSDLYVGGNFYSTYDGTLTDLNGIARYSGDGTWSALPHYGLGDAVSALAVIGNDLYVGGYFYQTTYGAVTNLNGIARYSRGTWSALPHGGLKSPAVSTLFVNGTDLYVSGAFTQTADSQVTNLNHIAKLAMAPDSPILLTPPDGTLTTPQAITLAWQAAGGLAPDGYNVLVDGAPLTTTASTSAAMSLGYGTHTWTVRAYNAVGASDWAVTRTVQVSQPGSTPTLLAPLNGTVTTTHAITFAWQSGDSGYNLQVDGSVITTTNTTSALVLSEGVHTWTVRAFTAGIYSAWAPVWTVAVTQPVGSPIPLSPTNGTVTTTHALTFAWQSGAGSPPTGYNLQVDGSLITTTQTTSATVLSAGVHTWKVRAYNAAGDSAWTTLGSVEVTPVAPDTAAWSALANRGLNSVFGVFALAVIGRDLYVGGWFTGSADGMVTNLNNIARYSGGTWSALAHNGLNSFVTALAVMGSDLYAGGPGVEWTADSAVYLKGVAKYSGGDWSDTGWGDNSWTGGNPYIFVDALTVSGSDLYTGGSFVSRDCRENIAKYSGGGTWSALANCGLNGGVFALAVSGSDLYAGGTFTRDFDDSVTETMKSLNHIAQYSGGAWSALPNNGLNGTVNALALMGNDLYAGGTFTQTTDGTVTNLNGIAKYSGGTWLALTDNGLNGNVSTLFVRGSDLYVGGTFTQTADSRVTNLNNIAKLSGGGTWSALPHHGLNGNVNALAVLGGDLYVGGAFTQTADGAVTNLNGIARLGYVIDLPLVLKH